MAILPPYLLIARIWEKKYSVYICWAYLMRADEDIRMKKTALLECM